MTDVPKEKKFDFEVGEALSYILTIFTFRQNTRFYLLVSHFYSAMLKLFCQVVSSML